MTRIVSGKQAVTEALRAGTHLLSLHTTPKGFDELRTLARSKGVPTKTRSREELDDLAEGVRHQGVVAVAEAYPYRTVEDLLDGVSPTSTLVVLDEVTDPQNFGAIVRTSVALGVHGLVVQKHRAVGVTTASTRASAGATEHARIAQVHNIQKTLLALRKEGFQIVGLDAGGSLPLHAWRPHVPHAVPTALVIGSEGKGLRRLVRERCDIMVEIPLTGPIASLNASVAAAIAIHHATSANQNEDDHG